MKWKNRVLLSPNDGGDVAVKNSVEDISPTPQVEEEFETEYVVSDEKETPELAERSIQEIIAENKKLKEQSEVATVLGNKFDSFANGLQQNQKPIVPQQMPYPVQKQGESEEEYAKRFNKEVFGKDPYKIMKSMVQEQLKPIVIQSNYQIQQLKRQQMKSDPIVSKYEDEINQRLMMLPPDQRVSPGAYEFVVQQVKVSHIDDIINEKVEAARNETREEVQRSRGNNLETNYNRQAPRKKQVRITTEQERKIQTMVNRGLDKKAATEYVLGEL